MYMKPTLPAAGGLWATRAFNPSRELASPHIGSGPGVAGLSAMQVKPLLPLRTTRIAPLALRSTMVASLAMAAGAACMAVAMIWASVILAIGWAAREAPARARTGRTTASDNGTRRLSIRTSCLAVRNPGKLAQCSGARQLGAGRRLTVFHLGK